MHRIYLAPAERRDMGDFLGTEVLGTGAALIGALDEWRKSTLPDLHSTPQMRRLLKANKRS